ncbi:MAG: PAS domain S-box protein [Myxococcota bacterium]|nr:PAS domain S-box protein [Myxococcota bacterium]
MVIRHAPGDSDARATIAARRGDRTIPPFAIVVVVAEEVEAGERLAVERDVLAAGAMECVATLGPRVIDRARARFELVQRALAAIEGLPVGVGITDAQGRILAMNAAALRTHGFDSVDEMLVHLAEYQSEFEVCDRDGTPLPVEEWPLSRAIRGEYVSDFEVRLRRAGGHDRLVSYIVLPLREAPSAEWSDGRALLVFVIHDITERGQVNARRRESEERYRTLFENVDDGFCIIQLIIDEEDRAIDYRFVEANPAFERHTGLCDAIGKTARALVPDLDQRWFELYGAVARTGEPARFTEHAPAMGRWFEVSAVRVGPAEERMVALLFADITERRDAERRLSESEARARAAAVATEAERGVLDAILATAPARIMLADAKGRPVRMNPASEALWGRSPRTESIGEYTQWKGWWADASERHGRPLEVHEWPMSRALGGETVRDDVVEIEPFDAPGTRRTIVVSGAPVRDAEGHVIAGVVAQMNISALVEAERAVRESERRFRALADNIAQLAWIADDDGSIFWFNRRWYEYTGTRPEQMKGWGWQSVHHPDHLERVVEKFRRYLSSQTVWEDTFPLRGEDGEYRWFLSRAVPIRDESGALVQWFGTNTDVTEQREAEQAVREASRRKDEFLQMLAHELRNPLAPLRIAVSLLANVGATDPMLERARAVIDRQVTHLTRLVDDLLDVSRVARGHIELRRERCDLGALVRQTIDDHRARFAGRELSVDVPSEPLWVDGDPVRLAQALGNVLHNAAEFTSQREQVRVRVARAPDEPVAIVRIEDTGVGMDEALLARLFQPFSQADQGLARSKGGLGLGLALTKGLIELHGGTIEAQSEGPGRGAVFTVRVPLAPLPERERPIGEDAPEHEPAARAEGLHVVVIEDNVDSAEILASALSMFGHRVEVAYDGRTGIETARAARPDIVISDIGLPGGVDGYEVARTLRSDPALGSVFLIALSGYCRAEDRARSRDAGFDAHLAKPISLEELESFLERPEPAQETDTSSP